MRTLTLRLSDELLFDKSLARASSSEDVILSSLECLALLLSSTVASKASLNSSNSFSNTGSSSLIAFPTSLSSSASFDTGVSVTSFSILSAIRMNNSTSSDLSADASAIGSISDVNGSFFFSKMSIVRFAFSSAALRSNISRLLSKFI